MKIRRLVLLCLSVSALAACVASADQGPNTPGTLEYSTSLAFNRSTFSVEDTDISTSVTHLNAAAGVARSMTPNLQLGGALLLQHRARSGEGQNGLGAALGGAWNFAPQGNVVPFFAAGLGAIAYSSDGETDKALLLPMLRAGFRSMIGGNKSLNVSLGFQHESNSESALPGNSNVFDVGVGVSFFQGH